MFKTGLSAIIAVIGLVVFSLGLFLYIRMDEWGPYTDGQMIIGAITFIINAVAYFLPLKDWTYMLYTVVNFGFWIAETVITGMIWNSSNKQTIITTIIINETINN